MGVFKVFWTLQGKVDNRRIKKQTPSDGIFEVCDIPYKSGSTNKHHTLDIYYPKDTTTPLPTIFDIHGGGWMYGEKRINKHHCMYLASRGFAVINISYRLVPEVQIDGQIQDIFDALHFIEKNSTEYKLDLSRLFISGDSAGGHLALLTSIINNSDSLKEKYNVKGIEANFKAIGVSCAAFDLHFVYKLRHIFLARELLVALMGKDFKNSKFRQDFTIKNLLKDNKIPPIYFTSCRKDFMLKQARDFKTLLDEKKLPYKFRIWEERKYKKLKHVYNVTNPQYPESIETNNEMCEFFRDRE